MNKNTLEIFVKSFFLKKRNKLNYVPKKLYIILKKNKNYAKREKKKKKKNCNS